MFLFRYFDIQKGTKQRLLKIVDEPSEKAVDMANFLKQILIENGLELTKMAALTADNTNANFGGIQRRGQNNLFFLLKQDHPSLNGIGCVSHIANNSVRHAVEQLDYDLANFCTTLCGHLNSALRWEKYKEVAKNLEIKVLNFPDYCPTRWLSLGAICEEICRQWMAIESYFRSCSDKECPKFMRKIFNDDLTPKAEEYRILFSFCSFALAQFNKFNLISQKKELAFPEMMKAFLALKRRIQQAHDEHYFGNDANERLIRLEEEGSLDICGRLKAEFLNFYENSLEYLNKWSAHINELADYVSDWLLFEKRPSFQKISEAYKKFCGNTPEELDNLFNEVAELNELLDKLSGTGFEDKEIEERWTKLFKNKNFVLIKKLVAILFSFFPSNSFCESIFSILKNLKTDERNSMEPKLINSLISIKLNADFNCIQAYDIFISQPQLLKQVKSQEKYKINLIQTVTMICSCREREIIKEKTTNQGKMVLALFRRTFTTRRILIIFLFATLYLFGRTLYECSKKWSTPTTTALGHRQFASDAEFFAKMQDIVREEIRSQQARERLKTEILVSKLAEQFNFKRISQSADNSAEERTILLTESATNDDKPMPALSFRLHVNFSRLFNFF